MLFCIFNWHKIEGIELVLTGCLLCLTVSSRKNRTQGASNGSGSPCSAASFSAACFGF